MVSLFNRIQKTLAQRRQANLYRRPRISDSPQQPHQIIDGQSLLSFCSNDYLGLAQHPQIIKAFQQAADQYGVGSGAAHLVNGHSRPHQALEEALAELTGRERALLFSTGYMANLGVVSALLDAKDVVFQDKLNHASLLDAGRLSGAKQVRYAHNNVQHLCKRLQKQSEGQAMIVTDGVFSMDGDVAPIKALAELAKAQQAWLMVDDAHGFGVLGKMGSGLLEQEGLGQDDVPLLVGTLGKACGTAGAFVAARTEIIEYLIQTARPYIYTTAQPPAVAAATLVSLKLMQTEPWRREHLQQLIQQFRQGALALGLNLMPSATPIQPVSVGDSAQALAMSQALQRCGIAVTAIRPPTVPPNTARLRITFSAAHTAQDVEQLLTALETVLGIYPR